MSTDGWGEELTPPPSTVPTPSAACNNLVGGTAAAAASKVIGMPHDDPTIVSKVEEKKPATGIVGMRQGSSGFGVKSLTSNATPTPVAAGRATTAANGISAVRSSSGIGVQRLSQDAAPNLVNIFGFGGSIAATTPRTTSPTFVLKSGVSNGHNASYDKSTPGGGTPATTTIANGIVDAKKTAGFEDTMLNTAWGRAGMAQAVKDTTARAVSPVKPPAGTPSTALSPATQFGRQVQGKDEGKVFLKACFNCGLYDHRTDNCPHHLKKFYCFNCGEEGHHAVDCFKPPTRPHEDAQRPPIIFVPKEMEVEQLYHQGVPKGAMFDTLFDSKVQTMRSGLEETRPEERAIFTTFDKLYLPDKIAQNVIRSGYSKPTPVQQNAMPVIIAGSDLLACAQTGSGKTAAYLLPIMSKLLEEKDYSTSAEYCIMPRCLIIAPTRELALQIHNECRKFGHGTIIECRVAYGGVAVSYQRDQLNKRGSVIVGTTGRLLQFIQEGTISLAKVGFFSDPSVSWYEADRMLDMGFGDDIRAITTHKDMPGSHLRQTLMFSATFPTAVQQQAKNLLKANYQMLTIDAIGAANKCITQSVILCDASAKKNTLLELLDIDIKNYRVDKESDVFSKKTLIFVSKKAFVDCLGAILCDDGIPATIIHSDRLQYERHEAMEGFASGKKPVMIATAVAERGLDIKGVDHVINYDMPESVDDYVHRIGRTGRVGNPGRATSFYVIAKDQKLAVGLKKCMEDAGQVVPDWLKQEAAAGVVGQGAAPTQEEETW